MRDDNEIEFKQRTLKEAVSEVEALLLQAATQRGDRTNRVIVNLWYGGDMTKAAAEDNTLVGIRVASIDFTYEPPGFKDGQLAGYCGGSLMDGDSNEAMLACAYAERAILARCCYYEDDDEHQAGEVAEWDQRLVEACYPEAEEQS